MQLCYICKVPWEPYHRCRGKSKKQSDDDNDFCTRASDSDSCTEDDDSSTLEENSDPYIVDR